MATHRKNSSKKRMRAGEFAVAAFLGLAVAATPAVAAADTSGSSDSDNKPSNDNGPSGDGAAGSGGTGSTGTGGAGGTGGTGPTTGLDADDADDDQDVDDEDADELDDDDLDEDDDDLDEDEDEDDEDADELDNDDLDEDQDAYDELDDELTGGTDTVDPPVVDPPVVEPPVVEPPVVEPPVVEPPVVEPTDTTANTETETLTDPAEPDGPDAGGSVQLLMVNDEPQLSAANVLDWDFDLVPKPPVIPAFEPFNEFINAVAGWLNGLLPAYDPDPLLNPTQVAGGFVTALFAVLQGTYWNGQPTLFTFGAYILMSAAYQRYEQLATNHLPGAPTLAAGGLPLTWKLTSVDPDGNPLIYSVDLGDQPNNGLITMLPDGSFSFVPTNPVDLVTGTDVTFRVRINDSLGFLTSPLTPNGNDAYFDVSFHYPGLGVDNLPPLGGLPSNTLGDGNGIVRGTVVGVIDPNNDPLSYSIKGANGATTAYTDGGGIVHVYADGRYIYIPKVNKVPVLGDVAYADSFTILVSDGKGGTADVLVPLGVLGITSPLNDVGVTKNLQGDGTIKGGVSLGNDNDGLFTYSVGTGPAKGTVTVNADGTYTYTPTTAGWNESDTFTIVGTFNGLEITVATVSVVPKSNTAPTSPLTDGGLGGASGITTGNIGASDADDDPLHYSVDGYGGASTKVLSNGAIITVDSTGKWSYIPGLNSGVLGIIADSFTVYITDGKGGQTSTFVTVGTHDLDIGVSKNVSNGTVTGGLGLTAGEQGLMTYKLGSGPSKGTVTVNADGTYTYTATTAGWNQSDSFTIVGMVGGKEITVANVSFVPKPNAAPTSPLTDGKTVFGGTGIATGNIGASDADNDTLHYSVTGYGGASSAVLGNGSIVAVDSTGKWSFVPGLDSGFLGGIVSSFTVYVTDGKGGQTSTFVTVGTHDLDIDVTATPIGTGVVSGGLSLNAEERALFTYSASNPSRGTVTVNSDGTYSYTRTAPGHQGGAADTFDIVGTIGGASIVIARVTVTPNLLNVAPAAGTPTFTENSTLGALGLYTHYAKGKINAVDADGDPISYGVTPILGSSFGTANGGSVIVYEDGSFSYSILARTSSYFHAAANANATGNTVADSFNITVTDSFGASTTITVSIAIPKWNDAPSSTVTVGGKTTDALGVVRGTVTGSDDDGDPLTYTLVGGTNGTAATAGGGIVRFTGNSFTYIPTVGRATDSFQVLIKDGHGGETVATVSLTGLTTPSPVTNINTSTANVVTGQLNTATNTGLTYSIAGQGSKGTAVMVNPATGAFRYERNVSLGHTQTPGDTFTILATDANGNSVVIASVTVTPTVPNASPSPGSWNITESKLEENRNFLGILTGDSTQTTKGTLSATDPDNDAVTFAPGTYTTVDGGTVVITAGGNFTYTIEKPNSYFHAASQDGASGGQISDTFTATAVDAFGGSTPYTVTVPTLKRNSNPSGSVSALTPSTRLFYNQSTTFDINFSDSDGDSPVITSVSSTTLGSVQIIGTSVKYTSYTVPNSNLFSGPLRYSPSETFTVYFKDGFGGTSSMQITF